MTICTLYRRRHMNPVPERCCSRSSTLLVESHVPSGEDTNTRKSAAQIGRKGG